MADYSHLSEGPLTLLVGHEANYSLDNHSAEMGLLYSRKQPADGDLTERLASAFKAALTACRRLEEEPSPSGQSQVPQRRRVPSSQRPPQRNQRRRRRKNPADCPRPGTRQLFAGAEYALERDDAPQLRLNLRIRCQTDADTETLLGNLAA